ncbi:hypothetical protein, partial [Endozoicomonas atrinae]|uniref:hypothetical protein n=1 Tax=Endozoicomonas atrinae TaxID=1333660 RepID=UPI001585FEDA
TGYATLDELERFLKRQNIRYAKTGKDRLVTTQAAIDACFLQLPGATEDDELIPIAFSKSLSCRQLCLGIITMHYLEQMSRRPQLPEGFNDVD